MPSWLLAAKLVTCCQVGYLLSSWLLVAKLVTCCQVGYLLPIWLLVANLVTCFQVGYLFPSWCFAKLVTCCKVGYLLPSWLHTLWWVGYLLPSLFLVLVFPIYNVIQYIGFVTYTGCLSKTMGKHFFENKQRQKLLTVMFDRQCVLC